MRKTLSIVLGVIILGVIAAFIYVVSVPAPEDVFTEFYILGPGGGATNYPTELEAGEKAELILGIISHEPKAMSYRVEIEADGVEIGGVGPVSLEPGEKFEQVVNFTLDRPGEMHKVAFLLYKEGQTEASESLHLWLDVTE